ncbi:hypothetical protein [Ferruginibacter sp.]
MKNSGAFAALKIMHRALVAGLLLFFSVMLFLAYSKSITPALPQLDRTLQVVAVLIGAAAFFAGTNLFKKKLLQLRDDTATDPKQKFEQYRIACIIHWALIEGPALFCGICFFLTGNYAFIALGGMLMIALAMLAPVKLKTALQLGISVEDIDQL